MGQYEFLATAAIGFNISSFATILYKAHTTQKVDGFPYIWLFSNIIAQTLMIVYAVLNKAYGIYIPSLFIWTGLIYMLYIKIRRT